MAFSIVLISECGLCKDLITIIERYMGSIQDLLQQCYLVQSYLRMDYPVWSPGALCVSWSSEIFGLKTVIDVFGNMSFMNIAKHPQSKDLSVTFPTDNVFYMNEKNVQDTALFRLFGTMRPEDWTPDDHYEDEEDWQAYDDDD